MRPILLIHGYGSEERNLTAADIYGDLPQRLRAEFGDVVMDVNLSRWISLNDGISLDDVSLGLERAINRAGSALLTSGFHVVVHSTGALVVKNWMRLFPRKPSPVANLVHLAGANFGSGLAHVGRGQLSRWGRFILGTGRGLKVLDELEFGAAKTLDLHTWFLSTGNNIYDDYQTQEFCLTGSQTLANLRAVPIRYVKEDSSDNTVRTSASNLNFNHVTVVPREEARRLSAEDLNALIVSRRRDERVKSEYYQLDVSQLAAARREVPFTVLYETAHFGEKIGIVAGEDNRSRVMPLLIRALNTPYDPDAYTEMVKAFAANTNATMSRVGRLKNTITDWNRQQQYEAHAQVIFRLRDQFGDDVAHFDITFRSRGQGANRLERMIEDKHRNRRHPGTMMFYLRTQKFDGKTRKWVDLLDDCCALDIEITGHEPESEDIAYLPLTIDLKKAHVANVVQNFRTTVIDVALMRLPREKVFELSAAP